MRASRAACDLRAGLPARHPAQHARGVSSAPTIAQAPSTSTVSAVRQEPPISSAAAASGRNAERMPRPIQYIGKICATTCTQPHSCWTG